jgi:putative redox protein
MKSKIKLERINDAMNFRASNELRKSILIDGDPDIGGVNNGVRPMELLLMGVAGCSAIDVVFILGRMKLKLDDLQIEVEGIKEKVEEHKEFSKIHMNFIAQGEFKRQKLEKAVKLSVDKYCSVSKILERSAEISYSIVYNGE